MTLKHDRSGSQTDVITCTDCPHWSAIRFGIEEGLRCASDHERMQHPNTFAARENEAAWRKRHAADSSPVGVVSA